MPNLAAAGKPILRCGCQKLICINSLIRLYFIVERMRIFQARTKWPGGGGIRAQRVIPDPKGHVL
jgi:hypothetical protein